MRLGLPIISPRIAGTLGVLFLSSALAGCATAPTQYLASNAGAVAAIASVDPTLLAANERVQQAVSRQDLARAEVLPELSLRASYSAHLVDNSSSTARAHDSSYGLSFSLPITDAIAGIGSIRAANSNLNAEIEAQNTVQSEVLLRVIRAAALNVKAQASATTLNNQFLELRQFYARQQERNRAGRVSTAELQQIQARLSALNATLEGARANALEANIHLMAVAGDYALQDIQPRNLTSVIPQTSELAVQIALAQNPRLKEANWRQASARQEVDASMLSMGPDVSLSMNANLYENWDTNGALDAGENVDVRLDFRVPLFDGGRNLANNSIVRSQHREQTYQAQAIRSNIISDASSQWEHARSLRTILGYAENRVIQSQRAYEGVLAAERIGAASIDQSLKAFNDLTEALIGRSDAEYQLVVQSHQLIATLGLLQSIYGLATAG